jgi:uncharacterized damage-inducible protein DinB
MRFRESPYFEMLKPELSRIDGPGDFSAHARFAAGFMHGIPEAKAAFAYAPGKWTTSQVLGHIIDAHLVFLGRILFLARGENKPLPGFDEDRWAAAAGHERLAVGALASLYAQASGLTQSLLAVLPQDSLKKEGTANDLLLSGEDILVYMMAHELHHIEVIKSRYLAP